MYPILFSFGPISIASVSIFLIVAWCVWSFLFWRHLRDCAFDEPSIFDLMFSMSVWAFVVSRLAYVALNFGQFSSNILRIAAIWIQPGMSVYGALLGALLAAFTFRYKTKIRFADIADAFASSFLVAYAIGSIGSFLDGGIVGKVVHFPISVLYVGHIGHRFPVQLFECLAAVLVLLALIPIGREGKKRGSRPGMTAIWTSLLMTPILFGLEFLKDTHVYLHVLSANQLVLILMFGQAVGAMSVYGGGIVTMKRSLALTKSRIVRFFGGMYAKLSKRSTQSDSDTP